MKTTVELHYTSDEDCNCNISHDTFHSERINIIPTKKEIIAALKDYEAHEHTVCKTLTLVFIHIVDEDVVHVEHILGYATWKPTYKKWDYKTCAFNPLEPDNIYYQ